MYLHGPLLLGPPLLVFITTLQFNYLLNVCGDPLNPALNILLRHFLPRFLPGKIGFLPSLLYAFLSSSTLQPRPGRLNCI